MSSDFHDNFSHGSSGWLPGGDRTYKVSVEHRAGDDFIHVVVTGDAGLKFEESSPRVPLKILYGLESIGLRATNARVTFNFAALDTPRPHSDAYLQIATKATEDLLRHFWTGDAVTGYILPTWNGYPSAKLPDPRGALWDRGTLIRVLDNMHSVTKDATLLQRIKSEWKHTKPLFKRAEFEAAGSQMNTACDDCGWNALMLLMIYRDTGDKDALSYAQGLVTNSINRWQDGKLGGGLWYSDDRKQKSLYQVGLVLAALEISDATGNRALRKQAMGCYE